MPAFYDNTIPAFLTDSTNHILGRLTAQTADAGFYQQNRDATLAWRLQITLLKDSLTSLSATHNLASATLLLEYPIPRRAKRIDAVLLVSDLIIVMEFKCGAAAYPGPAIAQVEDYCLDLRDFHHASRSNPLIPLLIATDAPISANTIRPLDPASLNTDSSDHLPTTLLANTQTLAPTIEAILQTYLSKVYQPLDPHVWNHSPYSPTPTIIEAAQSLYAGHNVRDITHSNAGEENLTRTTDAVLAAIATARAQRKKLICFITGVPGAGKTLAGLNIVHNQKLHDGHLGAFLSGNGPLVRVLTEALARDQSTRLKIPLAESRRKVSTFIQNVHRFLDTYHNQPTQIPPDKVIIFDEAQRAWNAAQSQNKFQRNFSESQLILSIMDRHLDWAVVVALIGNGQEINRGEAGLAEWGRAITAHFSHWNILISPELKLPTPGSTDALFDQLPPNLTIAENPDLHLRVNIRSYKAQKLSDFVAALLSFNAPLAQQIARELPAYPLAFTRDLNTARSWLHRHQRGSRRTGLIASSGGRRLRAHGLDVTADLDVENWFLNPPSDVRSSYLSITHIFGNSYSGRADFASTCTRESGRLQPDHTVRERAAEYVGDVSRRCATTDRPDQPDLRRGV